jgi:hypothetical protein
MRGVIAWKSIDRRCEELCSAAVTSVMDDGTVAPAITERGIVWQSRTITRVSSIA